MDKYPRSIESRGRKYSLFGLIFLLIGSIAIFLVGFSIVFVSFNRWFLNYVPGLFSLIFIWGLPIFLLISIKLGYTASKNGDKNFGRFILYSGIILIMVEIIFLIRVISIFNVVY